MPQSLHVLAPTSMVSAYDQTRFAITETGVQAVQESKSTEIEWLISMNNIN
jgi:hypothetical protein